MRTDGRAGTLFVVATPIGNLEDVTERAKRVLEAVDVVCCEDTRHTGQLLKLLGLRAKRLVSLHAHNEDERVAFVLETLRDGGEVALVSDAGTPLVSDPGAHLVAACVAAGAAVVAVPGACAALAALVVSAFGVERFRFEGFLPRRGEARERRLEALSASEEPVVCYEAPGRVAATLADLARACGPTRRVAICRELTKLHEEVWRGTLASASTSPPVEAERGEYVLVLDGAPRPEGPADDDLAAALAALATAGLARRDAVAAVEALLGAKHRAAYGAALKVAFPGPDGGGEA